jgi:quinol monooxygenase YgiN
VSELQGIARFRFHEGKLEEFKRLSAQAMEIVRTKDTGMLQYDIYFNDDQSECIVLERYRDSETLIEHIAHLGDLMESILATVSVVHGELLGEPSAELRAKLAGSESRFSSRPTCRCRHQDLAGRAFRWSIVVKEQRRGHSGHPDRGHEAHRPRARTRFPRDRV